MPDELIIIIRDPIAIQAVRTAAEHDGVSVDAAAERALLRCARLGVFPSDNMGPLEEAQVWGGT